MARTSPTPTKPSSLKPQTYRLRVFEIEDKKEAIAHEVFSRSIEARKIDDARRKAIKVVNGEFKRTRSVSFTHDTNGKLEMIAVGVLPRRVTA